MINTRTQHVLLCALCALLLFLNVVEVAAADGSGVDEVISNRRRRLKHLRSRRNLKGAPLNLFQQSQSTAAEEVVATSQQLRGHNDDDQPPPSPTPPLNLFKQTRIINGDVVEGKNGAYPFQVQLGWGYCGGELIAPDIVLTAAHCIDGGSPSTVDIWDGSEMTRRPVERGAVHPNYSNKQLHDDIALMKLTEPALAVKEVNDGSKTYWELVDDYDWVEIPPLIRLQRYQTPSQCTSLFAQGLAEDITTMTVIGHGTTEGGNLSEELREADVHYVTNSVCQQQYSNVPITDDMLCASDTVDEQDACQGDSGGPLFTRLPAGDYQLLTLVGVVSWGEGCALKEFPGVYSRVTANAYWVDEVVCGTNGYSPKSCTADGKIRDFALDALLANNTRRRTQDVSTNISRTLADELVKGVDYAGPATLKEEVCELLGGNADETLSPSSSSPSTSDSPSHAPIIPPSMKPSVSPSSRPSHAPIISPSMKPSVSPSLKPSTTPSGSPSKPPGKSPTKKFITKDKNANQKAKGIMYQLQAETGDVIIESISFQKRDDKDTNVEVYFRLGSYEDFPGKGMNAYDWGPPVFDGIPAKTPSGLREAVLDDVLTIPEGEMASIYLSGKKDFMFQKGGQEFTVSDDAGDFKVFTGSAMKKPFEQRLASADFVGEFTYYTYTRPTKVTSTPSSSPSLSPSSSPSSSKHPTLSPTSTPSLSPSSSNLPSLPPDEDTSSPSMLPSNLPSLTPSEGPSSSPSEDGRGGGPKEYKTPNVNKAGAGSKGVMFSITAKSKEVSITSLGMMGTETKESNLWIYYQNGSYDFDAMDEDEWIEAFKGKVVLDRNELVDVELAEEIVIPAGGTVSLYVLSKKGVLYTKSSADEFDIYAASEDFSMRVGVTTKKEFEKPEKLAEFAGRIMYQTKA